MKVSKTLHLRSVIMNKLKEITAVPVVFNNAHDEIGGTYVVCELSKTVIDGFDSYTLELNVWDHNSSTLSIELLADKIEEELDGLVVHDEKCTLVFYKQIRTYVDDPSRDIQRIMLRIDTQYFWKGAE